MISCYQKSAPESESGRAHHTDHNLAFLQINDKDILTDAGKISHALALEIAERNFDEYKKIEAKEFGDGFDEFAEEATKIIGKSKKT